MTPNDSPQPPDSPRVEPALLALIGRSRAADDSPPFSDGALLELARGERELLWLDSSAALVNSTDAEFVVDPDARRRGLGTRMLQLLTARSTGDLLFWAHGDHPGARALGLRFDLKAVRTLLRMEARVPPASPTPEGGELAVGASARATVERAAESTAQGTIRAFRLPEDAEAWLKLNARAFAEHPEQGAISRADLDLLVTEPWYDSQDFLLLHEGDALLGFCWLKVERAGHGAGLGEFYVVGIDPRRQGERLGQRLVTAGMARLASRGIRSAHLYVEGDNAPALRLYRSFGFTERSVDIQYRWSARG
ncbi:MAG: mycothiol synthase [Rhodoglobus sp.]